MLKVVKSFKIYPKINKSSQKFIEFIIRTDIINFSMRVLPLDFLLSNSLISAVKNLHNSEIKQNKLQRKRRISFTLTFLAKGKL